MQRSKNSQKFTPNSSFPYNPKKYKDVPRQTRIPKEVQSSSSHKNSTIFKRAPSRKNRKSIKRKQDKSSKGLFGHKAIISVPQGQVNLTGAVIEKVDESCLSVAVLPRILSP